MHSVVYYNNNAVDFYDTKSNIFIVSEKAIRVLNVV